jgi:hypothetical protein
LFLKRNCLVTHEKVAKYDTGRFALRGQFCDFIGLVRQNSRPSASAKFLIKNLDIQDRFSFEAAILSRRLLQIGEVGIVALPLATGTACAAGFVVFDPFVIGF